MTSLHYMIQNLRTLEDISKLFTKLSSRKVIPVDIFGLVACNCWFNEENTGIFYARFRDGKTYAAIGKEFNLTHGCVAAKCFKAVARLRFF